MNCQRDLDLGSAKMTNQIWLLMQLAEADGLGEEGNESDWCVLTGAGVPCLLPEARLTCAIRSAHFD